MFDDLRIKKKQCLWHEMVKGESILLRICM
jgi:hypothetical protein